MAGEPDNCALRAVGPSGYAPTSVQSSRSRTSQAAARRRARPGTHRLPFNQPDAAPAKLRPAVGRVMYPRASLVHRMDLSLPPATCEVITVHDVVAWKFPDEAQPARFALEESRRAAAVV